MILMQVDTDADDVCKYHFCSFHFFFFSGGNQLEEDSFPS